MRVALAGRRVGPLCQRNHPIRLSDLIYVASKTHRNHVRLRDTMECRLEAL